VTIRVHVPPGRSRNDWPVLAIIYQMFHIIVCPGNRRLAVNVYELMGMEEIVVDKEVVGETPAGPVYRTIPPRKSVRLYMRNGASFSVWDDDRELLDAIQAQIKFGDVDNGETADVDS
jgi:hypothetical protein